MSELPEDLAALDRRLAAVRFEPRASLGPEIAGRAARGERPEPREPSRWRVPLAAAAVLFLALAGWRVADATRQVDRCCQDLDGGGDADDGLLVISRHGKDVTRLAIYEDRDGSGTLTPGDAIRFERQGRPAILGPLLPGIVTSEFCCLDYDGGGPSDDALVVLRLPSNRITMAAIYERDGPRAALR